MGKLGEGSQAVVHGTTFKTVAFKSFRHGTYCQNPAEDCEREAAILQTFNCINIVGFYGTVEIGFSVNGIVMERCTSEDFASTKFIENGILNLQAFRNACVDLFTALEVVHSAGIVHMDVKPENFLLGMDGHYKLCDFAMSVPMGEKIYALARGTPEFSDPEAFEGAYAHYLQDIWGAMASIINVLNRRSPPSLKEAFKKNRRKELTDPSLGKFLKRGSFLQIEHVWELCIEEAGNCASLAKLGIAHLADFREMVGYGICPRLTRKNAIYILQCDFLQVNSDDK